MAAIIRLKRKACDEPADGLVIALKKPKCDLSDVSEVLFKFAATLNSEKESVRDHIQAVLSKEKPAKFTKWRDPKNIAVSESTVKKICDKLKAEQKSANEKKKLDYLNNRRLIFKEEFQDAEDTFSKDAEVRRLFHLYDIIEENEEVKKQTEEVKSIIMCNDEPLVREKVNDYVFDVYIAEGHIDRTFVDETVSVRPCSLTEDDIYSGDSDDSEEIYDDEDDSNDENNWRNEYPEDRDSHSEKEKNSEDSNDSDDYGDDVPYSEEMSVAFHDFGIDDDEDEVNDQRPFDYSRIMSELKEEYSED